MAMHSAFAWVYVPTPMQSLWPMTQKTGASDSNSIPVDSSRPMVGGQCKGPFSFAWEKTKRGRVCLNLFNPVLGGQCQCPIIVAMVLHTLGVPAHSARRPDARAPRRRNHTSLDSSLRQWLIGFSPRSPWYIRGGETPTTPPHHRNLGGGEDWEPWGGGGGGLPFFSRDRDVCK